MELEGEDKNLARGMSKFLVGGGGGASPPISPSRKNPETLINYSKSNGKNTCDFLQIRF